MDDGGDSQEQRICQEYHSYPLDSEVSDYHIFEIASVIEDWETLAPELDLTVSDQEEIKQDFHHSYYAQKTKALRRWKSTRCSSRKGASYKSLIKMCCSLRLVGLAEAIAKCSGSEEKPRNIQMLEMLYWYLVDCYKGQIHPSVIQWPSKHLGTSLTGDQRHCFYDLILHEAPLNTRSHDVHAVPQSFHALPSVSLSGVLEKKSSGRLLVYFEGIAGCGKSTLCWHISNTWAEKRLLTQFDILIHVHLNDPRIQCASRLSDIIPHHDPKFQQEVAEAIVSLKGKGVCFLLDGLDEASCSSRLFEFLLNKVIPGEPLSCPELSLILTSRPNVRVTKGLESFIQSRIMITGFKREDLNQYLDHTLGVDTDERKKLAETFKISPRLEGLCSLPINAAIMSFVMPFVKDKVPATQTELYQSLMCNLLVRHADNCFPERDTFIDDLLNGLPDEIRGPFTALCSVAYCSSRELKQLFRANEVDNTLGLLHIHRRITMFGPQQYYSFDHVSLQEFLAAIHLSKMDGGSQPQIQAMKEILDKNPSSLVLPFFAGLTRLANGEALKLLSNCLPQALGNEQIVRHYEEGKNDPQQKALAFMNCLFESKNASLLQSPQTDLPKNTGIHQRVEGLYDGQQFQQPQVEFRSLSLHYMPLTALDCLSLGCYINAKSRLHRPQQSLIYAFDLLGCSLDPLGIHLLFTELKKGLSKCTPIQVQLILARNKFEKESLLSLKELLKGQSNVGGVGLCSCFDPSVVDLNFTLKCLIEGLASNSSCGFIDLSANNFGTSHIYHIILLLRTCPQIHWLDLKSFNLRNAMPLFSRAAAFTMLRSLDLSKCNISNSDLVLFGQCTRCNWFLHQLIVHNNPFNHEGLSEFLALYVNNPYSLLHFLGTDKELRQDHLHTLERIARYRIQLGHPLLLPQSYLNAPNFANAIMATLRLQALRIQQK